MTVITIDDPDPYIAAMAEAARDQGLDPPAAVLRNADFDVDVWQSGGFCMVLVLNLAGDEIWITDDSTNQTYTVGYYDEEGLEESTEANEYVEASLGELPSLIRHYEQRIGR